MWGAENYEWYNFLDEMNYEDWFVFPADPMMTDRYHIHQGESETMTIDVYSDQGVPVMLGSPNAMIVVLFIKDQPVAGYSYNIPTGTTFWNSALTYQQIDSFSQNHITITINSTTSQTFPAGHMMAYIKTRTGQKVDEYRFRLAVVKKGQTKLDII